MGHEVYICYDEKDQLTADAICHVLEDNKIKCWLKTRDLGVNHMVEGIMEAINESQVMVLIFSSHSKHSNFVNTEVDIAFTENIPILVFKIDESKLDGGLEFFLNNKHWLDAYPDPQVKFESLIRDTSILLGHPISKPVVSSKKTMIDNEALKQDIRDRSSEPLRELSPPFDVPGNKLSDDGTLDDGVEADRDVPVPFDVPGNKLSEVEEVVLKPDVPIRKISETVDEPVEEVPKPVEDVVLKPDVPVRKASETVEKPVRDVPKPAGDSEIIQPPGGSALSKFKIPIIIGVIAIIAIGAFAFMSFNGSGSGDIPSDVSMKITDFHMDDVRKEGLGWDYSYSVSGTINPQPEDAKNYVIASYFYDGGGNLINSTETPLNDAQSMGKGMMLGSLNSDSKDIVRVEVKLMNKDDIIVAHDESQIK